MLIGKVANAKQQVIAVQLALDRKMLMTEKKRKLIEMIKANEAASSAKQEQGDY